MTARKDDLVVWSASGYDEPVGKAVKRRIYVQQLRILNEIWGISDDLLAAVATAMTLTSDDEF